MELHPEGVPTGAAMRRWTRRIARRRSPASPVELFTDVYTALLVLVVVVTVVLRSAAIQGEALTEARVSDVGAGLSPAWVVLLLAVAALAVLGGVLARLGPVSLNVAEATWWLALPADRRSLLRTALWRWPAVAAVLGAWLGGAVALGLAAGLVDTAALVLLGAGLGIALALTLALAQTTRGGRQRSRRLADLTLAAVPVLAVVLVLAPTPAPAVPAALVPALAVVVALAVALAHRAQARVERVRDAGLRERGVVTGEAAIAVLSLDTRALGRALAESARPARRPRSSALGWLAPLPRVLRAPGALVTADLLLLVRSPRHLAQLVLTACLPVAALLVPEPVTALVIVAVLVGGYAAALATVEGARTAQVNPALDALLPLSQRHVRLVRTLLPSAVMLLWNLAVLGAAAWRYADGDWWGWLGLAVLSAPVWAAGALRGAYRKLPDWSGPLVHTPMGALPPGIGAMFATGPDMAVLGAIPVMVALLAGEVSPGSLLLQAALTVAVVSRAGKA